MSSFSDEFESNTHPTESTHPFDDDDNEDGYVAVADYPNLPDSDHVFNDNDVTTFVDDDAVFVGSHVPILPPPSDMQEEASALREWRRQNAIQLEEKEKKEREILSQIIEEAQEYKIAFHEKRKVTCESNKSNNREKEKSFLANHETFHKEADKNYWKAIAELIPNEVPAIERKRGKKDQEKKPSIAVIQGPKPGKPTDLARMRQIIVKLKHDTPTHLKLASPPKDAEPPKSTTAVATTPEAVVTA